MLNITDYAFDKMLGIEVLRGPREFNTAQTVGNVYKLASKKLLL